MFAPFSKEGIGLHSGVPCRVRLAPGALDQGTILRRDGCTIPVNGSACDEEAVLATVLRWGSARVSTVEHLFSALNACGAVDVTIDVEGPEIPILDGSARPYADALLENGAKFNPRYLPVNGPLEIRFNESIARIVPVAAPSEVFLEVHLEYESPHVGPRKATYRPHSMSYVSAIAPARTFALEEDVKRILGAGMGKGGGLDNAVIIGNDGPLNPGGFRLDGEPARHKILDGIGDFYLLGGIPRAQMTFVRPGHGLMREVVRQLAPQLIFD